MMGELASASAIVRAACMEALAGETALVGVRLYEVAPAGARPPYLVVGPDTAMRRRWAGGGGSEHRLVISLWLAELGRATALAAAVERALQHATLLRDGFRVVSVAVTRTSARMTPTGWIQGVTDVRAFVEEVGDAG